MNTVEALKELYKSFGGKLTDTYSNIADGIPVGNYSVIPDCFAALAEIAGGSIELPVVTASDNGSVLSVVNGAWAKGLKIKKKTVSYEITSSMTAYNSIIFKINSNNDDIGKMIVIGYGLTADSYALLPGGGSNVILGLTSTSGYGTYGLNVRAELATGYYPTGTYTLDVYYIDLA